MDKTLTTSPWTTLMDYPDGLPKWTSLKWTTPKNTISDYILTLHVLNKNTAANTKSTDSNQFEKALEMKCIRGTPGVLNITNLMSQ